MTHKSAFLWAGFSATLLTERYSSILWIIDLLSGSFLTRRIPIYRKWKKNRNYSFISLSASRPSRPSIEQIFRLFELAFLNPENTCCFTFHCSHWLSYWKYCMPLYGGGGGEWRRKGVHSSTNKQSAKDWQTCTQVPHTVVKLGLENLGGKRRRKVGQSMRSTGSTAIQKDTGKGIVLHAFPRL